MFCAYCACQVSQVCQRVQTKRNKTDVLWEDIEQTAEGAMKNKKKLRSAAALFALNPSTTFYRTQKARTKLGNVESKLMFHPYKHCEIFS